jgi:group I intron endonuclease
MGIIYVLENKINSKKYVGQTRQTFRRRWTHHLDDRDCRMVITRAIKKYGPDNFQKHIYHVPNELLDHFEIEMIKRLGTIAPRGYNLETGGNDRKIMHPETIEKIRKQRIGSKASEETKNKQKAAWRRPGYREHMSEIHKGKSPGNKGVYKTPLAASICSVCGKIYYRKPGYKITKYCSKKCSGIAQKIKYDSLNLKKECPFCHKIFEYKKCKPKIYCSQACRLKGNPPHNKKIICITTGETFDSIREASKKYKLPYSKVGAVCRGERKTTGKKVFNFLGEVYHR